MPFDSDAIEKEIVVRTTPEKAFRALTSEEALRRPRPRLDAEGQHRGL